MKKVAPAMAAGNMMVVKPSELAPITPLMLGKVLHEAGLPAGVYNVVPGYGPTAGLPLASHPDVRRRDRVRGRRRRTLCRRDPVRRLCWQRPDLRAGRARARAS
jgi:hypothetical protein